jgi:hypothetical protein
VTAEDIRISVDILHQWQAEQAAEANQPRLPLDPAPASPKPITTKNGGVL